MIVNQLFNPRWSRLLPTLLRTLRALVIWYALIIVFFPGFVSEWPDRLMLIGIGLITVLFCFLQEAARGGA